MDKMWSEKEKVFCSAVR